ncbi:hypothetical protein OE749_08060 [Aestuariibacter sp. AA17]|uniref:Phosphatidate cytidylyltransferase n=1 Tax=Fluctibacter corallii TaxID=2984329 RepID=A0ABT3A8P8_9ALTE|nr:hypothetical protein [Aestuariibacter sp. AA17]MCV2884647.1 hypothetical protein [Aestuariibacter sp. AA17]
MKKNASLLAVIVIAISSALMGIPLWAVILIVSIGSVVELLLNKK